MLREFLLALLSLGDPSASVDLQGQARVIDGDTIEIADTRVRIFGIDAVEKDQTCKTASGRDFACGEQVSAWLGNLVGSEVVTCDRRDTDRYGRAVAVCHIGPTDIGAALVSAGMATAYRKYSRDYIAQEEVAKTAGAGLWAGTFDRPSDYRRGRIVGAEPTGNCKIKGNISKNGRLYHMPGQGSYDRTGIRPEKGERWFCTEAEARAAGWRAAGSPAASGRGS